MATFDQISSRTRRLVAEATAGYFDATTLDEQINTAYAIAQARIRILMPDLFKWSAKANIVANQAYYSKPTNQHVRRYEILCDDGKYREMRLLLDGQAVPHADDILTATDASERSAARTAYTDEGPEIRLWPTPTASLTDGLQCWYDEVLVMSAAADTPRMPEELHRLIAYGAATLCLDESDDAVEQVAQQIKMQWERVFGDDPGALAVLRRYFPLSANYQITGYGIPMAGGQRGRGITP